MKKIVLLIILSPFILASCIKDLERDNPLDGNTNDYGAELYLTYPFWPDDTYCYLYIDGSYQYAFNGYYTYVMDRECGFDSTYNYVYKLEGKSTGYYDYKLELSGGSILYEGSFYVSTSCSAIDLYSNTSKSAIKPNDIELSTICTPERNVR